MGLEVDGLPAVEVGAVAVEVVAGAEAVEEKSSK